MTYRTQSRDNSKYGYNRAIEHLARICSLSDWRSVQMVMLTTALDCSQDKGKQFFVMAGFASSAERWSEFDGEWRKRLGDDGLAYFHMYSFTQCIHRAAGPFDETWMGKENRRQILLADLLSIIQSHAWQKFACILPVNSLRMFSEESRNDFLPTLIATAGRLVWGDVEAWRKRDHYQNPSRMVFEDGDDDQETLTRAMKDLTGRKPSYELKKDDPENGISAFTPLQAADILAYESQKLTAKFDHSIDVKLRFPYHQLEQIPGDIKVLRADGVKVIDELLRVIRYFDQNPLGSSNVQ